MPSFIQSIQQPPRSFVKTEDGDELLQASCFFEDVIYPQWKKQLDHLVLLAKEEPDDLKESVTFGQWKVMSSGLMGRFIVQGFNVARFKKPTDHQTIETNRAFVSNTIKHIVSRMGSKENTDENFKVILGAMVETVEQQQAFFDSMIPIVARAVSTALVHAEQRLVEALKTTELLFSFTINGNNQIRIKEVQFETKEEAVKAVNAVLKAMIQAKIPDRARLASDCYERANNLLKQKLFGPSEEWCSFCGGKVGCCGCLKV